MFREMRRSKQQMTAEECTAVLCSAQRGVLAVLGDDEYPYTVPMDFVYADGRLWFHGALEGHKTDAIRRHDKVSFCVLSEGIPEPDSWWLHFHSVVVFGRIRIVKDEAERELRLRQLGEKYFPSTDVLEEEMTHAHRAAVFVLEPEHITGKRVREK